jgi:hypothetical protein
VSRSHGDFRRPLAGPNLGFSLFGLCLVVRKHSIADMRLLTATFIGAVIGGAALLAQTTQEAQQTLTPKEVKWPTAAPAAGTAGVAGSTDGRAEGRSQTAGPLHAAAANSPKHKDSGAFSQG